jgi:hypothetical protein
MIVIGRAAPDLSQARQNNQQGKTAVRLRHLWRGNGAFLMVKVSEADTKGNADGQKNEKESFQKVHRQEEQEKSRQKVRKEDGQKIIAEEEGKNRETEEAGDDPQQDQRRLSRRGRQHHRHRRAA